MNVFARIKSVVFRKKDLVFIFMFIVFAGLYYNSFIDKGILNIHTWRQADCLSITRHYAEGANFFEPEMNILLSDNDTRGRTAGEFPILYFIIGILWKLLGESYMIYRLFYLLILFGGTFALYKSLRIILNNAFWATVIPLLLFTSPVFVVYGLGFLTDVPAISFVLIALYFLLRYHQGKVLKWFFASMMFFALAGLIKISSLIAFVFILGIFILELFSIKSLVNRKLFSCNKFEWIGFIAVILSIFSWYYYAQYYNDLHNFKYTFNAIYPIWTVEQGNLDEIFVGIFENMIHLFFSKSLLFLFLFIGIFNLFLRKRIPLLAYLSNILISLGSLIYFILWFPLLRNHDYYYVTFLILFVGILIPFIWFIKSNYHTIFKSRGLKIFMIILLSYNFLYCYSAVRLKTLSEKGSYVIIGNHKLVSHLRTANKHVSAYWNRFEKMKPYLKQLGINENDKVISLPDASFNISLYLMNRKGWTNFKQYNKTEDIENLIQKGAKYLFISDPYLLTKDFLSPFLIKKIGNFEGIEIFKLSEKMIQRKSK